MVRSRPASSSRLDFVQSSEPSIWCLDEGHQVGPHLSVPFGRLGVEADDEALVPRPVAHADLFHLEVAGGVW